MLFNPFTTKVHFWEECHSITVIYFGVERVNLQRGEWSKIPKKYDPLRCETSQLNMCLKIVIIITNTNTQYIPEILIPKLQYNLSLRIWKGVSTTFKCSCTLSYPKWWYPVQTFFFRSCDIYVVFGNFGRCSNDILVYYFIFFNFSTFLVSYCVKWWNTTCLFSLIITDLAVVSWNCIK